LINNRQQNGRRRGRGGQQPRNGQSNPHSNNRIDNRQRGNAAQLLEKYKTLARDAQMAGDRVNTEYYLQFADHYFRVLSENRARFEEQQQTQQRGRSRDDFGQDDEGEEDANPFTRPYAPREMNADDGWDEEEGEAQQPAPQQAQPQRERREYQPRERRPMQAERDGERETNERNQYRNGGDRQPREMQNERDGGDRNSYRTNERPQREAQADRDGGERGGYRSERQAREPQGEREAGERGYRNERQARDPQGEREGGERGYRNGGERGSYRRTNGSPPAGARPQPEAAEGDAPMAARAEEAPSSRIEIALPPALAAPAPAPVEMEAAPELPIEAPVDAATAEDAPAPKRRRTRKPKADAAPADA
jgi:hypothetical protein